MDLVLVRHGEAGEPDEQRWPGDMARPLTKKGQRKFKKAARGLGNLVKPDRVLASPYARTQQTADLLNWDADWPAATAHDALDEEHSPKDVLDEIADLPEKPKTIGLVGHGPSLGRLLQHLVNQDGTAEHTEGTKLELPKGGAALIHVKGKKLKAGKGELVWILNQKQLKAHQP